MPAPGTGDRIKTLVTSTGSSVLAENFPGLFVKMRPSVICPVLEPPPGHGS